MSSPPPPPPETRFVVRDGGARLAYIARPGAAPTVVFLGGYASDMTGTKARYLEDWCRERGQAFVRFDYRGHGLSSGRLVDGTISAWRDDALLAQLPQFARVEDGKSGTYGESRHYTGAV